MEESHDIEGFVLVGTTSVSTSASIRNWAMEEWIAHKSKHLAGSEYCE